MAQVKLPNGTLGLIVSSTNEAQQEDLFFPCEPRLFAVNVAGDPECGTLVFDLNKANEPDSARGAYLQSAFRVVKLPLGQPNAIAFQLDLTGKKDTQGGFFCEIMQAPTMEVPGGGSSGDKTAGAIELEVANNAAQINFDGGPGTTVVEGQDAPKAGGFGFGEGSHNFGGPFHVGVKGDKHFHGEDADGNPINALHIWTSANFFMNKLFDGPLRFELEYKFGDEKPHIVPCHLAWAGTDWAIWTSTDFYIPPPPLDLLKPRDPGRRYPNFDWVKPGLGVLSPLLPGQGEGGEGLPQIDSFNFGTIDEILGPIIDGRVSGSGIPMNLVASLSAVMAPALAFRPENYVPSTASTGLFDYVNASGAAADGAKQGNASRAAKKADSSSPVTVMASAFGAQGGFVDAGGSGSGTTYGGQGDPWLYTETPRGNITSGKKMSKYPGGTASGGVIFHPPETDLRDIDAGMVPANVTLSETRVMCAPGASFGVGIPNLETGSIKTGANWEYDSSTGDVVWHTYSFTTESEAIRLTNPTQLIRWMSGQSFYGEFSHTNTANRTWTFPDVTSTISSILFDTVAPTATATEGTFGWDTAANNLYVNNDGATGWTFVGGASSVTGSGANTRVAFWTSATVLSSDAGLTYNSATDALTVTGSVTISGLTIGSILFAGTGGLISQDNANLFWDNTNNVFVIGGTESSLVVSGTTYYPNLYIHNDAAGQTILGSFHKHSGTAASGAVVEFGRSRGTEASETVVSDNDAVARIGFTGFDGTDYERCAEILINIDDATPSGTSMGGEILFKTTAAGSVTPSTRVTIAADGGVSVASLTATYVLYAGASGLLTGESTFTYNASQDRLILSAANGPRLTTEVTGTSNAIEISNTASGDSFITYASGGTTFAAGLDFSTLRYAIAKTTALGTASDLFRLTTDSNFSYVGQAVSTGAADEFTHHDFNVAGGTITFTTGVTLATQRAVRFRRPTYAADAATQTITNAATLYIENAPLAGTNVSITNPYALWVDDGTVRFDGAAVFNLGMGDFDVQISGDNDPSLFFCDASTDRVGIGTSSPGAKLTIGGLQNPHIFWQTNSGDAGARNWGIITNQSAFGDFIIWRGTTNTDAPSVPVIYATSAGNVGIGTSGPDAKLDILSTSTQLRLTYTDGSIWRDATVDSSSNLKITSPTAGDCTFELEVSRTITGAVTDGYAGSLLLDPAYDAATAQTVTRHNYIDVQNVALTGAGPAALTDACVMRFDAAAGTHKAIDSGTTKTTPGTVDAWMKQNINGTIYYMPMYTSKTT